MGHVLNLIIDDFIAAYNTAENLFELVEQSAVFISPAYKRTSIWINEVKKEHDVDAKLRRRKNRSYKVVE